MKKWTLRILGGLVVLSASAFLVLMIPFSSWMETHRRDLVDGSLMTTTALGDIEYAIAGEGTTVLRVHGSPGGYDGVIAGPRARPQDFLGFQTIALSRPGFLRTPLSSGQTPAEQADLYAALLDKLEIKKVVVYAVSGGGPSAVQFAIRHPDRVMALVMVVPLLQSKGTSGSNGPSPVGGFFTNYAWWLGGEAMARGWGPDVMDGFDAQDPLEVEQMRVAMKSFIPGDLRKVGQENDKDQWTNLGIENWPLEKITAPTLIIHGNADTNAPYEGSAKAATRIPNVKLVTIEGGDHLIIVSRAKQILDEVHTFAKEHSGVP